MTLKELINRLTGQKQPDTPTESQLADPGQYAQKPPKKRLSVKVDRPQPYRVELDLKQLQNAVDTAKMPDSPNRELLYEMYNQVVKDSHLAAQMRIAVNTVLQSDFMLAKKNKEDEKAKELLLSPWFDDFIRLSLEAEFWGHSLIEFGELNDEGFFTEARLIPRRNVKQEFGLVVKEPSDDTGIPYRKALTRLALVEVGTPYDLGLLELAAKEVIVKDYARTDWSQASEKYGMPLLKILTDAQGGEEVDKMQRMAESFASNGYIILSREDDAEVLQTKNSDFYNIYKENISLCDEQISKLVNGQTGSSDEKAFVGSAQVHERILNNYTKARLRRMEYIINRQLLPFLIAWGYPLQEYTFYYNDLQAQPDNAKPTKQGQPRGTDDGKMSLDATDFF